MSSVISANLRRPGVYVGFDKTSSARGLVTAQRRVALVGASMTYVPWVTLTAYTLGAHVVASGNLYRAIVAGTTGAVAPTHTTGTAADGTVTWIYVQQAPLASATVQPYQMIAENDGDLTFGRGSELALMVRAAFQGGADAVANGDLPPEIWACMVADPGGGVRGTRTLTFTGTAAASGDIVLIVAGKTVRVGVTSGDVQNTIAATAKGVLDGILAKLPWTAAVTTNVVTLLANNAGVNTNAASLVVVSVPPGVTVVAAVGVAGTGSYDITASLDALQDKRYNAVAIANHLATDITDAKAWIGQVGAAGVHHWSHVFFGENGTLTTATTLATGSNSEDVTIVSAEDFTGTPGEIAAQTAVTVESKDYAGFNFDGHEMTVPLPLASPSLPTNTEQEVAIAAGNTILDRNDTLDKAKIVRWVTTKTTEAGVPFANLVDGSTIRSLYYAGEQILFALRLAMASMGETGPKNDEPTRNLLRSVVLRVCRLLEKRKILQNVDAHKDEIIITQDPLVASKVNVDVPNSVIPDLHQLGVRIRLIIE
jgi:phage tail sheath gpL-like